MRTNYKIGMYLGGLTLLVILIVLLTFRSFDRIETAAEARKNSFIILIHAEELFSSLKYAKTKERT
jgi:CHASE3 domain sensor protein